MRSSWRRSGRTRECEYQLRPFATAGACGFGAGSSTLIFGGPSELEIGGKRGHILVGQLIGNRLHDWILALTPTIGIQCLNEGFPRPTGDRGNAVEVARAPMTGHALVGEVSAVSDWAQRARAIHQGSTPKQPPISPELRAQCAPLRLSPSTFLRREFLTSACWPYSNFNPLSDRICCPGSRRRR